MNALFTIVFAYAAAMVALYAIAAAHSYIAPPFKLTRTPAADFLVFCDDDGMLCAIRSDGGNPYEYDAWQDYAAAYPAAIVRNDSRILHNGAAS